MLRNAFQTRSNRGKHLPDESVHLIDLKGGIINETGGFSNLTFHIVEAKFGLMDETGHLFRTVEHLVDKRKCFIDLPLHRPGEKFSIVDEMLRP